MSLEEAIRENTEAVRTLVDAIYRVREQSTPQRRASDPEPPTTLPPAATPSEPIARMVGAIQKDTARTQTVPVQAAPANDQIKLGVDEIAKLTKNLIQARGRSIAAEILASFGAKNIKELGPDDYLAYHNAVNLELNKVVEEA